MRKMWPVALVVLGLSALGVAGLLKARPGSSETAIRAQERFAAFPMKLGRWNGQDLPVSEKVLKAAEAQAHLSRGYVREDAGAAVSVLLLFGEPGALGAHTPDVCYEGAGYHRVGKVEKRCVPGEPAEFWTARFETAGAPPTALQVTWAHGANGEWKASESPRFDFADRRLIYKLYLARNLPAGAPTDMAKDPTDEFLALLLKELRETVTRPNG